ncbi:hypothetical protein [Streptomyces sp. NPDC000134]|uniref:hypothetical protein n=1 Tax=Streptomyces sp. NPDC000134 TaxID=3364536 RepID=UPI00368E329C
MPPPRAPWQVGDPLPEASVGPTAGAVTASPRPETPSADRPERESGRDAPADPPVPGVPASSPAAIGGPERARGVWQRFLRWWQGY